MVAVIQKRINSLYLDPSVPEPVAPKVLIFRHFNGTL